VRAIFKMVKASRKSDLTQRRKARQENQDKRAGLPGRFDSLLEDFDPPFGARAAPMSTTLSCSLRLCVFACQGCLSAVRTIFKMVKASRKYDLTQRRKARQENQDKTAGLPGRFDSLLEDFDPPFGARTAPIRTNAKSFFAPLRLCGSLSSNCHSRNCSVPYTATIPGDNHPPPLSDLSLRLCVNPSSNCHTRNRSVPYTATIPGRQSTSRKEPTPNPAVPPFILPPFESLREPAPADPFPLPASANPAPASQSAHQPQSPQSSTIAARSDPKSSR
jgi:hypothetical protein